MFQQPLQLTVERNGKDHGIVYMGVIGCDFLFLFKSAKYFLLCMAKELHHITISARWCSEVVLWKQI